MKIKKLNFNAKVPYHGSEDAAGYDLYAAWPDEDGCAAIKPGETVKIPTGLAIELPKGTFGAVFARSGLATKKGLRLANSVGIIDADYRGELMIALHNDSDQMQFVSSGDRIAQLIVLPYISVDKFEIVEELSDTERGEGGFSSTGTR